MKGAAVIAPARAAAQMPETVSPTGGEEALDSLARATGLALLLVSGHQPPSLAVANNNSVCRAFQSSPNHAHLCEPYCGQAHARAVEAGGLAHYRCHAGFHCIAQVVAEGAGGGRRLAVIGGRAFLRVADYRELAERVRAGDLADLFSPELFSNVIFASPQDLDDLSARLRSLSAEIVTRAGEVSPSELREADTMKRDATPGRAAGNANGAAPAAAQAVETAGGKVAPARSPKDYFAPGVTLREACRAIVSAVVENYGVTSAALMLREKDAFVPYGLAGKFGKRPPRVTLGAKESRLLKANGEVLSVPVSLRGQAGGHAAGELFTLAVGSEVRGALLVAETDLTGAQRRAVADYCREVSVPLEFLRLREELERRMRATSHLQVLAERIDAVEPDDAYTAILRHSAELLHAERGSLQLFDERAGELAVKAAIGPRAEAAQEARVALGDSVSGAVLSDGRPLVVRDIAATAHRPAPAERSYKTNSFISYPIIVGGRKVGVLNVTDKAGGGVYDEADLGLLDMIAPQVALALDRAQWHQKATQFQLLSITDPLTGLLNRRYLEERLSEELERSKRHRFPMSFLMLDIDDFKTYNDRNGHQAGDLALEMTAQTLKSALRAADVAARYGGEEFCILLPQTSQSEALVIADRIRRRVERTHYPHGKSQPLGAVTVSIGAASFGPDLDTPASIIHAADQALYAAKRRGKNCVHAFAPGDEDAGDPTNALNAHPRRKK